MLFLNEDSADAETDGESDLSSEDDGDIQCEILEKQRDEANQKLSELEKASSQLLKEINLLEVQFQIERLCRESAEALAVKVTKENKALKRRTQMLMPQISELPENLAAATFDPPSDLAFNGDVVDRGEDSSDEESLLLDSQAKITALQASVDALLAEKLQLEQQVEELTKEQDQLKEQLALEVEEKEAILRKMSKQSKTMNKIKRVSQLVTEEFTEMSQKLELAEGLRQHAEVFAHQMLEQQKAHSESVILMHSPEVGLQLQQALDQISNISTTLSDIQCYFQHQNQSAAEECSVLSELQNLREQLEKSEEEKKALDTQLSEANNTVTQLQEEVNQLQETLNKEDITHEPEEKATPAPPPPPPPPPPPAPTVYISSLDFLKSRRKNGASKSDSNKPPSLMGTKTKAVDEMIERIKKGIVLRPVNRIEEDDSSWKDQRSDNRKSAVLELKGMLDNMKRQHHRRVPSRRGTGRNIEEGELLRVLQRRRKAMGENQDPSSSTQTLDSLPGAECVPAAGAAPWAGESGNAPVLRRLKQNREKRDSRIRASALIISQEN